MKTSHATRDKIIGYATRQFFTHGYSKISTEELATGLAISKATLYKYFPSKDGLLDAVIDEFYRSQSALAREIVEDERLSIRDKIERFLTIVAARIAVLKAEALEDLERTMPDAYARLMELRKFIIMGQLTSLFRRGAETGAFRSDIDPVFVTHVFLAAVEALSRPEYLIRSPYSYDLVAKHIFTLVFEGYLPRTDSGSDPG